MTDLEKIQRMQDCNWIPANQYWREKYESSQAKLLAAQQKIKELEAIQEK